jgi:hypothetical protein
VACAGRTALYEVDPADAFDPRRRGGRMMKFARCRIPGEHKRAAAAFDGTQLARLNTIVVPLFSDLARCSSRRYASARGPPAPPFSRVQSTATTAAAISSVTPKATSGRSAHTGPRSAKRPRTPEGGRRNRAHANSKRNPGNFAPR